MSDILVEVAEAVPVEVNLPEKDNAIEMEVYYQDEVSLDTDLSLFYIKSGEKEIENYVENVSKPEINDYIETYAKPIVTEVVDNIATPVVEEYIEGTVKPEISRFAAEEMSSYAEVATTQAGIATAAAAEASTTAQTVDTKVAEFDTFVGEKTEEFEQTAQQATADSLANVEHARIWAEGEQAEVEPLGGELSSMGAADLAYALANAPEDTPIDTANMFAMNIFKGEKGDKGDKGDAGKDGKIGIEGFSTNCITEIPQDIKLELNNGTLTLKAGSKVYVPNGTGKFDVVTVASDKVVGQAGTVSGAFAFYRSDNGTCYSAAAHGLSSGATAPSSPAITTTWYDTTNNVIKVYDGSKWVSNVAFPLCRFSNSNSLVTSIDQVFNGFGYIGSTVFALPGVKGLIPNGRNADGSLRNIEFTYNEVKVFTTPYPSVTTYLALYTNHIAGLAGKIWTIYDETANRWIDVVSGKYVDWCTIGTVVADANAKITSFASIQPFHAVDRNDSSWVSAQAMPSGKYINLTLGASGSTYTAPANGYVVTRSDTTGTWSFLSIFNPETLLGNTSIHTTSGMVGLLQFLPVKKGNIFRLDYDQRTFSVFRFVYAEGDK